MAAFSKLLGYLAMPAGILWLGLLVLAAWWGKRRGRRAAIPVVALWVLYTFAGNVWVGGALIRSLEHKVQSIHPEDLKPVDALFVLGGGIKLGPRDYPEVAVSGDRVILAARLYRAGLTPFLITSGRSVPGLNEEHDFTLDTARVWQELGVPESAIIRISSPWNTSLEIEAYRRLKDERGWSRVGILSSAYHLPRIMRHCERNGLDAIPIAADHRGGAPALHLVNLIPKSAGFASVQVGLWERLGMLVGR